jgi:hypothetical protein
VSTVRMNMPAMLRLMELADYVIPFTLRAVAGHGVADLLADGPRSAPDLAGATGLDANALERLLRALTCKEILVEDPPGTFGLARLGGYLRTDHPYSVRGQLTLDPDEVRRFADEGGLVGVPAAAIPPGVPEEVRGDLARLAELADHALPTTIRAVTALGIAELIAEHPQPVATLAEKTGADPARLLAALRGLARVGIVTESAPECFGSTDLAELTRADRPHSLQGCLPLMTADVRAWAELHHTLRTGRPAFAYVHGQTYYEYLAERPEDNARFDASQEGATRLELRAALRGYDWGSAGTLVDVGGGNGTFLAGVLQRHPGLRGVLFDLPFVVPFSADILAAQGVADRCAVHGGSFFDGVPAGYDTYLLKRTLYNWDAESAVRILRAVRTAMRDDSRLLIFEPTRRPGDTFDVARLTDVIMLVFTGGALRTIDELSTLLGKAELHLSRLVPTPMFPVLEIVPA